MREVGTSPRPRRTGCAAGGQAAAGHDRSGAGAGAVRFGTQVVLTKEEAFGACQALADAGRVLVRTGSAAEADTLCSLFTLIEDRLAVG